MPFKSRAQKEYLRINEPEIYERWMREYGDGYVVDAESNQSWYELYYIDFRERGLVEKISNSL